MWLGIDFQLFYCVFSYISGSRRITGPPTIIIMPPTIITAPTLIQSFIVLEVGPSGLAPFELCSQLTSTACQNIHVMESAP